MFMLLLLFLDCHSILTSVTVTELSWNMCGCVVHVCAVCVCVVCVCGACVSCVCLCVCVCGVCVCLALVKADFRGHSQHFRPSYRGPC